MSRSATEISEGHTLNVEFDFKRSIKKWMSPNESVVCKDIMCMYTGIWEATAIAAVHNFEDSDPLEYGSPFLRSK